MAMTPIMAAFTRRHLNQIEGQAAASLKELAAGTADQRNHVVVIGFGQVGMAVTRHLVGLQLPVLALDYDPRRVRTSQARKLPIYFGNAARTEVLKAAHVGQAKLVIIAIYDQAMAVRVITLIRSLYPKLRIIARSADAGGVDGLRGAGANAVVVDGLTTALDIAQRAILLYEPDEEQGAELASAPAVIAATPIATEGASVADAETQAASPPEPAASVSLPAEPGSMTVVSDMEELHPVREMQAEEADLPLEETSAARLIDTATDDVVDDLSPDPAPISAKQKDPVPS
jgi:voltage-gated potassium channel Kch